MSNLAAGRSCDRSAPPPEGARGFTLVELLVSMAILSILLAIITSVIAETQRTWTQTVTRASQFREARAAFDLITRNLGQATLNTYWDYLRNNPDDPLEAPSKYVRQSELQFICGPAAVLLGGGNHPGHAVFFQAPLGVSDSADYEMLDNLLSARGYFIQHGSDSAFRPAFLSGLASPPVRHRFRLMEFAPPSENNLVYANPAGWYASAGAASSPFVRPVAENLIALFISPRVAQQDVPSGGLPTFIAPDYRYDSMAGGGTGVDRKHLLPPLVEVTLVAIDEASAQRLAEQNGDGMPSLLTGTGASFTEAARQKEDLAALESYLATQKLNFRIFSTTVALRTSKWSM